MNKIGFVLFHTGETRALLPTIALLAKKKYKLAIIPVGFAAKNCLPKKLNKYILIPKLIENYLGRNDEFNMFFNPGIVQDITAKLQDCRIVFFGSSAKIQEQVAKELFGKMKLAVYFDLHASKDKIHSFSRYVDDIIVTSKYVGQIITQQLHIKNKSPKITLARHGDFDTWLSQHNKNIKNKSKIRKKIDVSMTDKVILWAGGSGDFLANDVEEQGFLKFLKTFKLFKDKFSLRISPHPGLTCYNPHKQQHILHKYYVNNLLKEGFTPEEINKIFISYDTNMLASIATACVSISSTTGLQAIFLGIPAKNVFINKSHIIDGIESVNTVKRWKELLVKWDDELPQQLSQTEISQIGTPNISTQDLVLKMI
ncbi:MAG: hypothetical protein P1U74_06685 [Legionellaceae bacterium]|nr:hypothetical protein [Legionellaceae bacterium]